jgi:hypothetical protein
VPSTRPMHGLLVAPARGPASCFTARTLVTVAGLRPFRPSWKESLLVRLRPAPDCALALFIPPLRGVKEVLYQSELPWVVDHSKYAQAFGAHPTPHKEAIARTLRWFRETTK